MQCHLNKFIHLRRYDEIALLVHESVNDDLSKPAQHRVWPPDMARAHGWNLRMDGNRMMEVLSAHQQLKTYLPIIRDSPVYPVIYDCNRVVLSLPPIINGEHSKIKLETKDVFIDSSCRAEHAFDFYPFLVPPRFHSCHTWQQLSPHCHVTAIHHHFST